jgi:hypothetical protein
VAPCHPPCSSISPERNPRLIRAARVRSDGFQGPRVAVFGIPSTPGHYRPRPGCGKDATPPLLRTVARRRAPVPQALVNSLSFLPEPFERRPQNGHHRRLFSPWNRGPTAAFSGARRRATSAGHSHKTRADYYRSGLFRRKNLLVGSPRTPAAATCGTPRRARTLDAVSWNMRVAARELFFGLHEATSYIR